MCIENYSAPSMALNNSQFVIYILPVCICTYTYLYLYINVFVRIHTCIFTYVYKTGLTVGVVTHLAAQSHLTLFVSVQTVQVQGRPDHRGLVEVEAGRVVGCDLTVVQLQVAAAQRVVALALPHCGLHHGRQLGKVR